MRTKRIDTKVLKSSDHKRIGVEELLEIKSKPRTPPQPPRLSKLDLFINEQRKFNEVVLKQLNKQGDLLTKQTDFLAKVVKLNNLKTD